MLEVGIEEGSGRWPQQQAASKAARRVGGWWRAAAVLELVIAAACPARAANLAPAPTASPQVIEEGLRRQQESNRDSIPGGFLPRSAPPSGAVPPPLPGADGGVGIDEHPCFRIDELALEGPGAEDYQWLLGHAGALHQCLGPRGIDRVVKLLNAQLARRGLVTSRVSLPQQSLAEGRLVLHLHLGRVAGVSMVQAGSGRPDEDWGRWENAFPLAAGDLLDVRGVEQGVEQMNRLPSASVSTKLAPGPSADTSIIVIERRPRRWQDRVRGYVSLGNSGSHAMGRTSWAAGLALDDPFGINDILSVSLNGNAEHPSQGHRSRGTRLEYSVPLGYGLLTLGASRSRYSQNVQLTTSQVVSSGSSDSASVRWDQVLWRDASANVSSHAELSQRSASSYLDDLELLASRRLNTFAEAGLQWRALTEGHAAIDLMAAYRRGVPWLGAQDDLPPEAGGLTVRPRSWILRAGLLMPLTQPGTGDRDAPRPWRYSASFSSQFSRDMMTTTDQFAIGSRGTVRGFDGNAVLLAENGWTLRNELSLPVAVPGLTEGSFFMALDAGRVWGRSDGLLVGHFLAGAGFGLRGRRQAWQFDLSVGTPVAMPEGFRSAAVNVYAMASHAF